MYICNIYIYVYIYIYNDCFVYLVKRQPFTIEVGYYCYLNICTCNLKPCYEMSREKKKEEKVFGYYKNVDFTATLVKVHVMTNSCKSMVFFTRNFLLYCHKSQSLFSLQDQF